MSWKMVKLEDLAENGFMVDGDWIESKDQDPFGDIRLIQLADIGDGYFVNKSKRFINKKTAERLKCTFLKKNDILIARMPDPLGRACLFPFEDENKYITVVDVCVLRIKEGVDYKYVTYAINSPDFRNNLESQITGTTRLRIAGKKLKELQIPLPPLATQQRIAAILDAADALRRKDQELLQKYDALAQAIFIDMFGDPVKNEKGWEVKKLGEVLDVDAKAVAPNSLDEYHYVGLEHIEKQTGKILTIDKGDVISNKFLFTEKHILYGKLRPYLNKVATPDFSGICSTDILPLMPKKLFMKQFLVSILRSKNFVNHSNTNAVGANLPRANKEIILGYKTIIPNEEGMKLFSKKISLIESQKFEVEKQIIKSENLFQTLLQKSFKAASE